MVTSVPTLALFETLDTTKLAEKLNKELAKMGRATPLSVLVQVNTSGEASKNGVTQAEVPAIVAFIRTDCP